jgi:hypothetical protein
MTVSTTENRKSYAGNGVTLAFSFPFLFPATADLTVILVNDATGVETTKTLTTHYTVTGAGEAAGGTVTMLTAPATGETLLILREVDLVQETDFVEGDPLPPEALEAALDRLIMIDQQQQETLGRSLTLPASVSAGVSTELPLPSGSRVIGWNSDGTALVNYGAVDNTLLAVQLADPTGSAMIGHEAGTVADAISGAGKVVASIAGLRAITSGTTTHVFVAGYYATGDGGGGHYYYDAADTTSGDDGGAIIVAADGRRWKWVPQGHVSIEMFGGKVGDPATDNTPFLNAAYAYCKRSGIREIRFLKAGKYYFNTKPSKFGCGIKLVGPSARAFLVRNYSVTTTYYPTSTVANLIADAFLCWDGSDYVALGSDNDLNKGEGMRNLGVYAGTGTTGGIAIALTGTDTNNRGGYGLFENVVISGAGEFAGGYIVDGSQITTAGSQGIRDITAEGLYIFRCRTEHMRLKNACHHTYSQLVISDGGLGVTPKLQVNGDGTAAGNSTNVVITSLDCYGNISLTTCTEIVISGRTNTFDDTSSATNSIFTGYIATTFSNNSQTLRIVRTPAIEALVTRSGAANIPTAAWTPLGCDSEKYDRDNLHSTTTNATRITIPWVLQGTKIVLRANIALASNSTGIRGIRIIRNGLTVEAEDVRAAYAGSRFVGGVVTPPLTTATGDYFEVQVYQNSGADLAVDTTGCWFSVEAAR